MMTVEFSLDIAESSLNSSGESKVRVQGWLQSPLCITPIKAFWTKMETSWFVGLFSLTHHCLAPFTIELETVCFLYSDGLSLCSILYVTLTLNSLPSSNIACVILWRCSSILLTLYVQFQKHSLPKQSACCTSEFLSTWLVKFLFSGASREAWKNNVNSRRVKNICEIQAIIVVFWPNKKGVASFSRRRCPKFICLNLAFLLSNVSQIHGSLRFYDPFRVWKCRETNQILKKPKPNVISIKFVGSMIAKRVIASFSAKILIPRERKLKLL